MSKLVRGGLIQTSNPINDTSASIAEIKQVALDKHIPLIEQAGEKGVQVLCLQEIFNTPYFCPAQDPKWYAAA